MLHPPRCCSGNSVDPSNIVSPSWAWGKGVVQTSDGRTIICFSRQASVGVAASASAGRRLKQQVSFSTPSTATVSANLDLTQSRCWMHGHTWGWSGAVLTIIITRAEHLGDEGEINASAQ